MNNYIDVEALHGKKLLILGAYSPESDIVNAAKNLGVYTIAADNHTNWDDAPAKKVADEAWNISYTDIDALAKKCIERNVDGVIPGFSDLRFFSAQKLAKKLNKPFYSDGAALDVICDKKKFKQACIESGVIVPKSYEENDEIEFPVIVKPVDNAGSVGITVCYNKEEFSAALDYAKKNSGAGKIIIEQFFEADTLKIYFTIHNGIVDLSAMADRNACRFERDTPPLPLFYCYPSRYLEVFEKFHLDKWRKMIKSLGIKNGFLHFDALAFDNVVMPVDPGYRLDGALAYRIISRQSGINIIDMLASHSLIGSMGDDKIISSLENPHFKQPAFVLHVLLTAGKISEIIGLDEIKKLPSVFSVYTLKNIGSVLTKKAHYTQIFARIYLRADSFAEVKRDSEKILDTLIIKDELGKDMIIGREETRKILDALS